MEKDIINSIIEKEFLELTADERAELFEYCSSEEEYMQLKNMFTRIENMDFENPGPREETKKDLDLLFDQSYPKANQIWYSSLLTVIIPREKPVYRQPLLQIAAVALLIFLAVPLFNTTVSDSKSQLAKVEQSTEEKKSFDEIANAKDKNEQDVAGESELNLEATEFKAAEITTKPITGGMPHPGAALHDVLMNSGAVTISDHPDGIFIGSGEGEIAFSQPASETADLMDLLTVAF